MTIHIVIIYTVLVLFIVLSLIFAKGISKLQGKQAKQLKQIRNDVYDINDIVEPEPEKKVERREGAGDSGEKLPEVKPFEHGGV